MEPLAIKRIIERWERNLQASQCEDHEEHQLPARAYMEIANYTERQQEGYNIERRISSAKSDQNRGDVQGKGYKGIPLLRYWGALG